MLCSLILRTTTEWVQKKFKDMQRTCQLKCVTYSRHCVCILCNALIKDVWCFTIWSHNIAINVKEYKQHITHFLYCTYHLQKFKDISINFRNVLSAYCQKMEKKVFELIAFAIIWKYCIFVKNLVSTDLKFKTHITLNISLSNMN